MNRIYHADTSGMDIDQPEPNPHGRLADFAIPHDDNGPARKRLHSDIQTPSRPFRPTPTSPTYHFTQNTPFIFHAANLAVPPEPPQPVQQSQFRPYNPAEWAGTTFGFGHVEDVEMKEGESPARVKQDRSARVDTVQEMEGESRNHQKGKERGGGTQDGKSEVSSTAAAARPIAQGAIARVRRRRQREWRRRRDESESEEEQHDVVARPRNRGPVKTEHTYNLNMNSPTMRHSEIPALLLGYLQFFVNASVVVFVLYLAVQFVLTVRRDVKDKMAEASVEILQEIAECSQLYLTNRCDPALRVPAMDAPCRAWEACMHRDPTVVGRTNVMAETFAGVINSFVDPISWKTMGFTLVTLSFLIILTNSALFNLRHRAAPDPTHPPPPQHMYPPIGQPPWMQGQHHSYSGSQGAMQSSQGYMGSGEQGPAQICWDGQGEKKKKGWW